MREKIGPVVRIVEGYMLPSAATGCLTYFCGGMSPGWKWAVAIMVGLGTGGGVLLISLLGDWIARGGALDSALEQAIKTLALSLRMPEPSFQDPKVPVMRITVFIPKKVNGREVLYPRFRWNPIDMRVFRFGEEGFDKTRAFDKGDILVGLSWQDGHSYYESFRAVGDADGHGTVRPAKWAKQWTDLGTCEPLKWGEYVRSVRSAWTFPIYSPSKKDDEPRCLAVFAVDSTFPNAFHSPEEFDQRPLTQNRYSCLAEVHPRKMVAALVQGMVLVMLNRRTIDTLKAQFSAKPKTPMVFGLSDETNRPRSKTPGEGTDDI